MSLALCYREAYDKCDPQVNGEHREHSLPIHFEHICWFLHWKKPEIFAIIAMKMGRLQPLNLLVFGIQAC